MVHWIHSHNIIEFLNFVFYGDEKIHWNQALESSLKGQKCRIIKNK